MQAPVLIEVQALVQNPVQAPVAAPPVDALPVVAPPFPQITIPVPASVDVQIPVSGLSPSASPSGMLWLDYVTVAAPGQSKKCMPQHLLKFKL
jgi:hypothetical protein